MNKSKVLLLSLLIVCFLHKSCLACNSLVCGPIVSKCMITGSCNCDIKACKCCKQCFTCLSYLYTECCGCIDMCPKGNTTQPVLSTKSHIEDLDGVPGLFTALTAMDEQSWTTITFPVNFDAVLHGLKTDWDLIDSDKDDYDYEDTSEELPLINSDKCTVIFLTQCFSWNKCKSTCQNMGASSYRWFHDGCCECVGSSCVNYGINQSRCERCSNGFKRQRKILNNHRYVEKNHFLDSFSNEKMMYDDPRLDYGEVFGPLDDRHAEL